MRPTRFLCATEQDSQKAVRTTKYNNYNEAAAPHQHSTTAQKHYNKNLKITKEKNHSTIFSLNQISNAYGVFQISF